MRTLAIIPARGGSKGVPRKNIRLLGGKPLLAWTSEAALAAKQLSRIVVSTDDDEIADVARACGVEVPFMRPAELALDSSPTLPAMQHAVTALEAGGDRFDAVVLLEPTSPLRTPELIDRCVSLLETTGADSVATVLPVPASYNPHWVYFRDDSGFLRISTGEDDPISRRQDLPLAFHRDGSVFVTRRDVLMVHNTVYGSRLAPCLVDPSTSINIDTLDDWDRAEQMLARVRV